MELDKIKKLNLPDAPGVYFFLKGRSVLYVGKATSLKDRVRSYFNRDVVASRGGRIMAMVELADSLRFIQTDSVLEALILEASEIKKHQPKYNAQEKDDKSFNYVVITKEDWPRIEVVRGRELEEMYLCHTGGGRYPETAHRKLDAGFHRHDKRGEKSGQEKIKSIFGPFPQGKELKEALKIIRKIFPWRDQKCKPLLGKPCFNYQIGLCPGVCVGVVSQKDYAKIIKNIELLFAGKKSKILVNLEKEMRALAKRQEFEKAQIIKRQIFSLKHIQDIALVSARREAREGEAPFRIEAYDVAHLSGQNTVGVMTVVEDCEVNKDEYRKFKLKGASATKSDDIGNLKEILERRLAHTEWSLPNLIVVDGGRAQLNLANKIIKDANLLIDVVSVVKDEFHRAREVLGNSKAFAGHEKEILLANGEAHRFALKFHRQRRDKLI